MRLMVVKQMLPKPRLLKVLALTSLSLAPFRSRQRSSRRKKGSLQHHDMSRVLILNRVRLPEWVKTTVAQGKNFAKIKSSLRDLKLATVSSTGYGVTVFSFHFQGV